MLLDAKTTTKIGQNHQISLKGQTDQLCVIIGFYQSHT